MTMKVATAARNSIAKELWRADRRNRRSSQPARLRPLILSSGVVIGVIRDLGSRLGPEYSIRTQTKRLAIHFHGCWGPQLPNGFQNKYSCAPAVVRGLPSD